TVNSANDLVVSRGTSLSGIVPLNIIPAQPFITTIQPVAKAGDTIVIEAVGLGTASTGTGFFTTTAQPAPANPPATILPSNPPLRTVAMTIGGTAAAVGSVRMKPGSFGIYQVTATVPSISAADALP